MRRARRTLIITALLTAAIGFAGVWLRSGGVFPGASERARPNLLLIPLDTIRADRVSAYSYAEALAPSGAPFERAYTNSPQTLPDHAHDAGSDDLAQRDV